LWGGCAGGGWIQLAGEDYPFPPKRILHGAIAAKVTGTAVDELTGTLGAVLPDLVGANEHGWACLGPVDELLGAGLSFPLSLGPFNADVGARNLDLCMDLSDLKVEFVQGSNPAQIRLSVTHARMAFQSPAVVYGQVELIGTSDAACVIDNQLGLGDIPHAADVSFVVLATLAVDEDSAFALKTETESLEIHDIGVTIAQDCTLPECSDANPLDIGDPCLECTICDPANFGTDLFEFLNDLFGQAFDPVIAQVMDALSVPLLDELLNGRPLSIAAAISLSNTLGSLTESARTAADLGVLLRPAPGGFAVTGAGEQSGLEIRLAGGAAADSLAPCIGETGAEPIFEPGPFPEFPGVLADGTPYQLGIGISQALLNQAIWAMYESGGLCLGLTTREIADLTAGQVPLRAGLLDLILPGLARLAGRTASVRLAIVPHLKAEHFPVIQLAPPGTDATLRLRLQDFEVGIEAWVDNDYMRIMTITGRVDVDLKLATADTGFELIISDLKLGELTVSDHAAFAKARPDEIVGLAVDILVDVLSSGPLSLPFDPAEIQGLLGPSPIAIELLGIGATGPENDWLGAWFTLSAASP